MGPGARHTGVRQRGGCTIQERLRVERGSQHMTQAASGVGVCKSGLVQLGRELHHDQKLESGEERGVRIWMRGWAERRRVEPTNKHLLSHNFTDADRRGEVRAAREEIRLSLIPGLAIKVATPGDESEG